MSLLTQFYPGPGESGGNDGSSVVGGIYPGSLTMAFGTGAGRSNSIELLGANVSGGALQTQDGNPCL